jgi:putative DNA primase/helicase
MKNKYPPATLADAKAALKFIDADCDHDVWVKIGMALKSEFDEKEAYAAFKEWSETGDKYDPDSFINTWASIGEKAETGESITIGTLFFYAKENGYTTDIIDPNEQAIKLSIPKTAEATTVKKAKPAKAKKDIAAMVQKATNYWNASKPDVPHPYATAKGFKKHGLRVSGDCLLVPAYNENDEIQSIQRINSEGKFNLKDCTITGSYYPIKGN